MSDNPNNRRNNHPHNQAPSQAFPYMERYQEDTSTPNIFIPEMRQEFPSGIRSDFGNDPNTGMAPIKDYDAELDEIFGPDEGYDPFIESSLAVKKKADQFLQEMKTQFPNRYFISKRITQNPEVWEICLQKSYVIINDENYIRKLQNCFDVIIFPLPLLLITVRTILTNKDI